MNLADHQHALLRLIRYGSLDDVSDPYLSAVAVSPHLRLLQRIIVLWKTYELDQICILTTRYLQLGGRLEQTIKQFVQSTSLSPFIEEVGERFLDHLAAQDDMTLAALARSEAGLLAAARGHCNPIVVDWPCDPNTILAAVLQHDARFLTPPACRHRMIVDASLPHYFRVERVEQE